jgi:hypothetical protein
LKRLRLEVTRLQASIEVQLAFTSDEVHQAFEAEVERLAPEDTLLIALVRKQVPGGGVRNEVGSARSLPRQVLPLARYGDEQGGDMSAAFSIAALHGFPSPTDIRVTVRQVGTGREVVRRTFRKVSG